MPTDEELQAIKGRAAPRLMAIPSVTVRGTGRGEGASGLAFDQIPAAPAA